jgi:hypothetical protein
MTSTRGYNGYQNVIIFPGYCRYVLNFNFNKPLTVLNGNVTGNC